MSLSLSSKPPVLWAVRIISFSAMCICLWLFYRKLTGSISSIRGCGEGGDCEDIMGGRWSEWFHIPVTVLAAKIHAAIFTLTLPAVRQSLGRKGDQLLAAAGVIVTASAVYFLSLMYGVEKKFCPWCLGLHLGGLTEGALILAAAVRTQRTGTKGLLESAALTGLMALCVLGAGQIWGPKPETTRTSEGRLTEITPPPAPATVPAGSGQSPGAAPPPAPGRVIQFANSTLNLTFDTGKLPLLGSPTAPHVLVEYFDYTCSSCRTLAGDLKALKKKWPDQFAVIALPSPLNRSCNPYLKVRDHAGSCELAKLSLAFWYAKPAEFPAFHDFLLSLPLPIAEPQLAAARKKADELAGLVLMQAAVNDPRVAAQLQENLSAFARLTAASVVMPKLLVRSRVIEGVSRDTTLFIAEMEKEYGLTVSGSPVISQPR